MFYTETDFRRSNISDSKIFATESPFEINIHELKPVSLECFYKTMRRQFEALYAIEVSCISEEVIYAQRWLELNKCLIFTLSYFSSNILRHPAKKCQDSFNSDKYLIETSPDYLKWIERCDLPARNSTGTSILTHDLVKSLKRLTNETRDKIYISEISVFSENIKPDYVYRQIEIDLKLFEEFIRPTCIDYERSRLLKDKFWRYICDNIIGEILERIWCPI